MEKGSGGDGVQGDRSKVPGGRLTVNERKGTASSELESTESVLI